MLSLPPLAIYLGIYSMAFVILLGDRSFIEEKAECMSKMTNSLDNVTNVYAKCRMQNEKETWICFSFFCIILAWIDGKLPLISQNYKGISWLRNSWFVAKRCFQKWPEFALHLFFVVGHTTLFFRCFKLVILLAHLFSSLERRSPKSNKSFFTVKPPISNSNKVVAYENQTIGAHS